MMWFINTRPQDRADPLTTALTAAGFQVQNLPLLQLSACPWDSTLVELYRQLPDAEMIVVVSPMAVQVGMQYLHNAGINLAQLAAIQWIAVGKTTAQTLAEYGISSHVPEVETSEGMLNLPLFQASRRLRKVAFWRGAGGRQFMMDQLQQRGVQILNFVLYQRGCPPETPALFAEWVDNLEQQQASTVCVLITSEASWLNWLSLSQQYPVNLTNCHFLVLGQRLFDLVEGCTVQSSPFKVSQLADLEPETILQLVASLQGES